VKEALQTKADIIMLDNFQIGEMMQAVALINGKCKVEASGGINLETVKVIAETGVDFISVGALTHSVKSLDISLEIAIKE
jgi:nicotinate-nucleotide pyrophosphorylase (carboxylating)